MVLGLGQNIKGLKFMQRSKLTTQEIIKLYDSGMQVREISELAGIGEGGVWKRLRTVNHPMRYSKGSKWSKNKGKKEFLGLDGRWWVRDYYKPEEVNRNRLSERRYIVVMEEHLGFAIPKCMVVHHIDGDPTNDDIDNLALVTAAAHNTIHHLRRD